jgi:hypothetical protein
MKASLAAFQWAELASGEVATPTSPMAECLLSGAKFKKGTAVVIGLLLRSWPESNAEFCAMPEEAKRRNKDKKVDPLREIEFIFIE